MYKNLFWQVFFKANVAGTQKFCTQHAEKQLPQAAKEQFSQFSYPVHNLAKPVKINWLNWLEQTC